MKILKRTLISFLVIFGLAGFGTYLFLNQSLAPMTGQINISSLEHPVTVTRDHFGIPHIKAENKLDALRSLGFVIASERLFQMEISRRLTQGTLSEVFGEVALKSDKLYRSLMLRRSVERMLAKEKVEGRFDNKLWEEMTAYFDGVNQYMSTHSLPYELKILGIKPEPFTPLDAFIMTGHMAYSFGIALKADPLMSKLSQTLPENLFQALRNETLKSSLEVANLRKDIKPFELSTEGFFISSFEGSNAWLIAPHRSASGKSVFANDPHIGFSHPATWIEAHIQTPDFELYGHYLPLVPFAILGHSPHHAWGFTMLDNDDMDLYAETIDRKNKTSLFHSAPVPYQEWTEVLKVKDQPDVVLNLIETPHGPLMNEVFEHKDLAMKWAYHNQDNNPMKALRHMAEAQDMTAFEAALQHGCAPGLNVMYADAKNIAWWAFGEIAIKRNPNSDTIFDGASGKDEYERLLTWSEKPHIINPPNGIIVTANSRPINLDKDIRGEWQSENRFQTITEALNKKRLWTVEEVKQLQTKNFNIQSGNILAILMKNLDFPEGGSAQYENKIQGLKKWDLHSNIDSSDAALFHQWNNEVLLGILAKLPPEDQQIYLSTQYAWNFYERILFDENSGWWADLDRKKLITDAFIAALSKVKDKTWGDIHQVEYKHPLGRMKPLNLVLNLGPYPIPGAYNEINNNKAKGLGGNFDVVAGPSTRRIIDFANPKNSWGINPIGISGHILSPFYKDQVKLFIAGEYRPQLMDNEDIQKNKRYEMTLLPQTN